jgi:hypothetical protein
MLYKPFLETNINFQKHYIPARRILFANLKVEHIWETLS